MNDAILAEQLRKTGNLIDLLNNDNWVREADEEDFVEAGLGLQPYVDLIKEASPETLRRQRWYVQVLSILLPEMKEWLASWQLGRSFEAVYIETQQRLYKHLEQLTSEQRDWIEALLAEDEQPLPDEQKVRRAQVITWLAQLFTPEDWQAISAIAAQTIAHDIQQLGQEATAQTVL
ncbi:MAG: hypothetical protein AAGF98_13170 [Cyanobacteria bacterium P01_H01_bin.153]